MDDWVIFASIFGSVFLVVGLYSKAVHRMNSAIACSGPAIGMGCVLLYVGARWRIIPHIIASIPTLMMGFYLLYIGIPLELRERRSRAIRKRWEKLDEEESETSV